MSAAPRRKSAPRSQDYSRFEDLDGRHPYQEAVPDGYVSYEVRSRPGGEVVYLNFTLAKEMGLIAEDHPHALNEKLKKKILDTFALMIINEYDVENGRRFESKGVRPNRYMATRYLQLQHPNKQGKTSGDGRGIWNGTIRHKGKTWDVSSNGTGATCLSPATAIHGRHFKTGDPEISYGCGYAELEDGLAAGVMSEIFHRNGVPTERTLALIRYPGGWSINVRAGRNLLRPAHMFRYLKQGDIEGLRRVVDYFIDRQERNGEFRRLGDSKARYENFLSEITRYFAEVSALFEREYIFCWMDWDGDNILADQAGIIDYGSIRQFGLYHKKYRYDDVDRFSTTIEEQKYKARYTVQTFAQLTHAVITGKKLPVRGFRKHKALREFNRIFEEHKRRLLLKKMGFAPKAAEALLERHPRLIRDFERVYTYFEKKQSHRGEREVNDGVMTEAVFSMRDLLREYPRHLAVHQGPVDAKTFVDMAATSYAAPEDLRLTGYMRSRIREFQRLYVLIQEKAAEARRMSPERMGTELMMRASILNPFDRITGDGMIRVSQYLVGRIAQMGADEFHELVEHFIEYQSLEERTEPGSRPSSSRPMLRLVEIAREHRESV